MLAVALLALALQQDQTPRQSTTFNREYYDLAASTGGEFYFWAPGETLTYNLHAREDVLFAYGDLDGKRVLEIPIESGAKRMTVFSAVERKDIAVLIRPDGAIERGGVQSFQHMAIASIRNPVPGTWKLELHGAGPFAATAQVDPGADGIQLISVEFVEKGGRPGHEGMFPIKRAVKSGEKLRCRVNLSGPATETRLVFVGRDGSMIDSTKLEDEYVPCVVPSVPYRMGVAGTDANSRAFQRLMPPLRTP